jgi:hypothetical protein
MPELPPLKDLTFKTRKGGDLTIRYRVLPGEDREESGRQIKKPPTLSLDTMPEDFRMLQDEIPRIAEEVSKLNPGLKGSEVLVRLPMPPSTTNFYDFHEVKIKL